MPTTKPCPHYFEGYLFDYAVLANGTRLCGACYVEMVNRNSAAELTAYIRQSPLVDTLEYEEGDEDTVYFALHPPRPPQRRRCPICGLTYTPDDEHYENCPGADAPGIQVYG